MTPHEPQRYARRRRAALPMALAAFVALVVLSGSRTPTSVAGSIVPPLTVVVPAAQPIASAPAEDAAADAAEPIAPADDTADAAAATTEQEPADTSADDGEDDADAPSDSGDVAGDDGDDRVEIRHVFVVMLADTDVVALASDAGAAPYLSGTLVPEGTLLTRYRSVARGAVANGVALLSGQGPTAQTLADCPTFADVAPDELGADGQQLGDGCVYPPATGTVVEQLRAAGHGWRAYVEDVGAAAATTPSVPDPATPASETPAPSPTCRHPALGAADELRDPRPGDAYATRRNPFVYFHALLDGDECARRDVGLDRLDADLARGRRAPAFSYVVPNLCHDGRATPCAPGAPAGPAAADAFLAAIVPKILASPAYADGGLLVVTSDQPPPPAAGSAPPTTTPRTATAAPPAEYPNVGDAAAAGAGRVGALLVSPAVHAGATSRAPASHFTLLRLLSDLFELQPLGYAGSAELAPLPEKLFSVPAGDAGD